jgi:hypothetical protein
MQPSNLSVYSIASGKRQLDSGQLSSWIGQPGDAVAVDPTIRGLDMDVHIIVTKDIQRLPIQGLQLTTG